MLKYCRLRMKKVVLDEKNVCDYYTGVYFHTKEGISKVLSILIRE